MLTLSCSESRALLLNHLDPIVAYMWRCTGNESGWDAPSSEAAAEQERSRAYRGSHSIGSPHHGRGAQVGIATVFAMFATISTDPNWLFQFYDLVERFSPVGRASRDVEPEYTSRDRVTTQTVRGGHIV